MISALISSFPDKTASVLTQLPGASQFPYYKKWACISGERKFRLLNPKLGRKYHNTATQPEHDSHHQDSEKSSRGPEPQVAWTLFVTLVMVFAGALHLQSSSDIELQAPKENVSTRYSPPSLRSIGHATAATLLPNLKSEIQSLANISSPVTTGEIQTEVTQSTSAQSTPAEIDVGKDLGWIIERIPASEQ